MQTRNASRMPAHGPAPSPGNYYWIQRGLVGPPGRGSRNRYARTARIEFVTAFCGSAEKGKEERKVHHFVVVHISRMRGRFRLIKGIADPSVCSVSAPRLCDRACGWLRFFVDRMVIISHIYLWIAKSTFFLIDLRREFYFNHISHA